MDLPRPEGWTRENFFEDGTCIASKTVQGGVFIRRKHDILWVLVEGEANGEDLVACFRRGLASGMIDSWMPSLVDMSRFTGAVDWAAVRKLREMVSWGRGRRVRSRVAYVLRDRQFGTLVKIVAVLFPRSSHRAFYDLNEAVAWLGAPAGNGEGATGS